MRAENMRHFDAAMALGFILYVVALIVFGNDDWTGAGLGLGALSAALTVAGLL